MHSSSFTFVLGYAAAIAQLASDYSKTKLFEVDNNDYDWLGTHFWEVNPARGLEFAGEVAPKALGNKRPFVVGAMISLGWCLDLATSEHRARPALHMKRSSYRLNKPTSSLPRKARDLLRRHLDCAVRAGFISSMNAPKTNRIDTVRGVFIEGEPIYRGSGFFERAHIQIAV